MKVKHGKGVTLLSQSHKSVTNVIEWLCHRSQSQHVMGNIRTMESEVHSHNSSCIYSVENQMGTLSSSPC